jgi:prepilin-type N-terminal cleavage/methylation domain-containing protein
MKKQSGFTLIELLLVLAIIGIISAIAIPALLGQRSRARDKSCMSNVTAIIPDMVAEYDKLKEGGTTPAAIADFMGTAALPNIPEFFTAVNPWALAAAPQGFAQGAFVGESATDPGAATIKAATSVNQGQVQLGYLAPVAGANGVLAAAVMRSSGGVFSQTAGLD